MDSARTAALRNLAAEALGTFCLVFAGTGAIVVNDTLRTAADQGSVTHVGVSLVFGLVVMAMIYAVGDVSGAHLNPAVTAGFWLAKRFPGAGVAGYVAAQCLGALIASGLLRAMFPEHATLGATLPAGGALQAWIMELVLTFILMFVILGVSTGAKEKGMMAGAAIGGVIALEALFGGPVSGASMNPARSLAPAIVSGDFGSLWIYLTAPVAGAALAVPCCRCVHADCCCGPPVELAAE